jgi:hypothetical protein
MAGRRQIVLLHGGGARTLVSANEGKVLVTISVLSAQAALVPIEGPECMYVYP